MRRKKSFKNKRIKWEETIAVRSGRWFHCGPQGLTFPKRERLPAASLPFFHSDGARKAREWREAPRSRLWHAESPGGVNPRDGVSNRRTGCCGERKPKRLPPPFRRIRLITGCAGFRSKSSLAGDPFPVIGFDALHLFFRAQEEWHPLMDMFGLHGQHPLPARGNDAAGLLHDETYGIGLVHQA